MGVDNMWTYLLRNNICTYVNDGGRSKARFRSKNSGVRTDNRHMNDVLGYATDHLFFDMNSLIHGVYQSRKANTRATLNSLLHCVRNIVAFVKPRVSLGIAFDGVAPIAKLPVQKRRRAALPSLELYNTKPEQKKKSINGRNSHSQTAVQQTKQKPSPLPAGNASLPHERESEPASCDPASTERTTTVPSMSTHVRQAASMCHPAAAANATVPTAAAGKPEDNSTASLRCHVDCTQPSKQPVYSEDVIRNAVPLRREEISCGSQFAHACMEEVCKMLRCGVKGARYRILLVSDGNKPGEGETKIAEMIRFLWYTGRAQSNQSILIVSTDSDLALVELLATPFRRLALLHPVTFQLTNMGALFSRWLRDGRVGSSTAGMRESTNQNTSNDDDGNKMTERGCSKCEVIHCFASTGCVMPEDHAKTIEEKILQRYRVDFAFLMCLVGCDYYNGIDIGDALKMWRVYQNLSQQQGDKARLSSNALVVFKPTVHINVPALARLLGMQVTPSSTSYDNKHAPKRDGVRSCPSRERTRNEGGTNRHTKSDPAEDLCGGAESDVSATQPADDEDAVLDSAGGVASPAKADPAVSRVAAAGITLLQAALWNVKSILHGRCVDYNFIVPTSIRPSLRNLCASLGLKNIGALLESNKHTARLFRTTLPVLSPLEQYIAIMGPKVRYSSEVRRVLTTCVRNDTMKQLATCCDITYIVSVVRQIFSHVNVGMLPLSEQKAAERKKMDCEELCACELTYYAGCP